MGPGTVCGLGAPITRLGGPCTGSEAPELNYSTL